MEEKIVWDVTGGSYRLSFDDDCRSEHIWCSVALVDYDNPDDDNWVKIGCFYEKRELFPKCLALLMSRNVFPLLKSAAKNSDHERVAQYYLDELKKWATLEET